MSSPAIFADPTNGVANGLLSPRAHGASPADTAANRIRALFDSARVRLAPVQPTAADTARCIAQVDSLAKMFNVNLNAGRGGGRGGLPGGGCGRAAGGGRGGRGGGRGGADSLPVTHSDSMRVTFTRAVAALPQLTRGVEQGGHGGVSHTGGRAGEAVRRRVALRAACAHAVSRYHRLSGGRTRRRRVRRHGTVARHPRHAEPDAHRRSRRLQLLILALGDVQQRRIDGAVLRRVGRRRRGVLPQGRPEDWGADAIFKIVNGKMEFQSYYKLPAPQTALENCVAHNGSLIPIPGRTIMVQAWYQGGISVFEWTDPKHPHEIAFFDRGPNDGTRAMGGGFWSVYWYNGQIIGSEMQRGLDIFELTPSAAISQNEIDAAKIHPYGFPERAGSAAVRLAGDVRAVARVHRSARAVEGTRPDQVAAVRTGLSGAEGMSGGARRDALNKLAGQVSGYSGGSSDPQRVQWLAGSLKDLASATK